MINNNWLDVMFKQVGVSKGDLVNILENEEVMRALQRKKFDESVEFELDDISDSFFRDNCKLKAVSVLRKKLAEHLIIAAYCLRYRKTGESLLERMIKNPSCPYNPHMYIWVQLPKYIVVED